MLFGTNRAGFGGPWVGFYPFSQKPTILQYYRPLNCSDEVNDCEPLPIPDKTKPDAVKKLAATALYIHFCNRVCRKFLTLLKLCGFFFEEFFPPL